MCIYNTAVSPVEHTPIGLSVCVISSLSAEHGSFKPLEGSTAIVPSLWGWQSVFSKGAQQNTEDPVTKIHPDTAMKDVKRKDAVLRDVEMIATLI